jgi:hypothetical protein
MRNRVLSTLFVISILAIATSALAQSAAMVAEVPFDFTMGNRSFEKGSYRIQRAGPVLLLTNEQGKTWNILTAAYTDSKGPRQGQLVFNRYGDHYFLTRAVWPGGSGKELIKSALEIQVAKTYNDSRRLAINTR